MRRAGKLRLHTRSDKSALTSLPRQARPDKSVQTSPSSATDVHVPATSGYATSGALSASRRRAEPVSCDGHSPAHGAYAVRVAAAAGCRDQPLACAVYPPQRHHTGAGFERSSRAPRRPRRQLGRAVARQCARVCEHTQFAVEKGKNARAVFRLTRFTR